MRVEEQKKKGKISMNTVNLIGRLVRNPQTTYPTGEKQVAVTHYTLAVNRRGKDREETAYIRCVVFGKMAEFAESYFYKGVKVAVTGHLVTNSYKNENGNTVYTTDVVVERQEFAESRKQDSGNQAQASA